MIPAAFQRQVAAGGLRFETYLPPCTPQEFKQSLVPSYTHGVVQRR